MNQSQVSTSVELSFAHLSATICAELATGLADIEGIKRRYELTDRQWDKLKKSPVFRGMLKDALRRFHGDLNAGKRITLKSEVALEDSIPLLHAWAHDPEVAVGNRLDAIKQMAVLAGRTGKEQGAAGPAGGGFNINITVRGHEKGPTREVIELTSTPLLEVADEEAGEPSAA
jgi:hypothetical protein